MGTGPQITVPLPATDGSFVWAPAPLRQVGLTPAPIRTKSGEVTLDTIRSSGLITEIEYHGQGLAGRSAAVCAFNFQDDGCTITESDGTVHPLLGPGVEKVPNDARVSGTLRFLGELKPDATDLSIAVMPDSSVSKGDPVKITLPKHNDSPAIAAAGSAARPSLSPSPAVVTTPQSGAKVTIDRVDVLADHVQLHIVGTGGTKDVALAGTITSTMLTEPSGTEHALMSPTAADLVLKAGGSLDATLVFQGSLPVDVTTLNLTLGGHRATSEPPMTATLTIPAADRAQPVGGSTLGQVGAPAASVPSITASPAAARASATPTSASLTAADIVPLPVSTGAILGTPRSSIRGSTTAPQVASGPEVDPSADASAQRSLQDLGAQRTPDGWVVTLPDTVLFEYNKFDVMPAAAAKLDQIAKLLAYYDKARIGVQGHTDNTGDAAYNLDLSKKRAQAVADALSAKGVSTGRMTVTGLGLTRPIASNADDAGRAKNRRVEIVLSDNR